MSRRIAVIGTGYVGFITAVGLADFGNSLVGVDLDPYIVEKLSSGHNVRNIEEAKSPGRNDDEKA